LVSRSPLLVIEQPFFVFCAARPTSPVDRRIGHFNFCSVKLNGLMGSEDAFGGGIDCAELVNIYHVERAARRVSVRRKVLLLAWPNGACRLVLCFRRRTNS
jgi:hypothetical protein